MTAIPPVGTTGTLATPAAANSAAAAEPARAADVRALSRRLTVPDAVHDRARSPLLRRPLPEETACAAMPGAQSPAALHAAAPEVGPPPHTLGEPASAFAAMLARIEAGPQPAAPLALDISLPGAGLEPAPVATVARAADGSVSLVLHQAPQHVPLPPLLQAAQQRLRGPARPEPPARRPGADPSR